MKNSGCAPELQCLTFKRTIILMFTDVEMFHSKSGQYILSCITIIITVSETLQYFIYALCCVVNKVFGAGQLG